MKNIDFLLNKLRYVTNTKTDKELCKLLDISYSTLDTWKNNDKIPQKRLYEISQKVNISFNDLISERNNFLENDIEIATKLKDDIKINDILLEQVKNKASKFGLDINSYIEHLIIQDLKK